MDPASVVMAALARRFAPSQVDLIISMRSRDVPVPTIVAELRRTTNAVVQNKDVYNALQRAEREHVDGRSQVLDLLSALDGNADFV